jgi:hypothetical protein
VSFTNQANDEVSAEQRTRYVINKQHAASSDGDAGAESGSVRLSVRSGWRSWLIAASLRTTQHKP